MNLLFAQVRQQQGPPPGANEAVLTMVLAFYCAIFLISIASFVLQILLYVRMMNTLNACSKRNRKMEPGMVWLNLIPFFNLVWIILSILRISESLTEEYADRGLRGDGDYGKTTGIVYYVSLLLCAPVSLIVIFFYYSKLGGYLKELQRAGSMEREFEDDHRNDN